MRRKETGLERHKRRKNERDRQTERREEKENICFSAGCSRFYLCEIHLIEVAKHLSIHLEEMLPLFGERGKNMEEISGLIYASCDAVTMQPW